MVLAIRLFNCMYQSHCKTLNKLMRRLNHPACCFIMGYREGNDYSKAKLNRMVLIGKLILVAEIFLLSFTGTRSSPRVIMCRLDFQPHSTESKDLGAKMIFAVCEPRSTRLGLS